MHCWDHTDDIQDIGWDPKRVLGAGGWCQGQEEKVRKGKMK
jgi:hypothetical protein